ncbi:hypothetical protein L7F22_012398 [Adiantum nelumboides]|nr:hypothetical protein [Adiantum nelumboides]
MNRNHWEDLRLDLLVEEARLSWVGFDMRVLTSSDNLVGLRIPFSREVVDERDARSSLTMMAQISWEALQDVGLVRTTTGNWVFGALKGALDGGLDIPHSNNRFARFSKDEKSLNADAHRRYILGVRVADYMKMLHEDEPKKYQFQFSSFMKGGVELNV